MGHQETRATSLIGQLAAWAQERPEHPAVVSGEQVLSYRELQAAVGVGAQVLREAGVSAGDRVLLAGTNSLEFVIAYLATHRVHATAVPITPKMSPDQLAATIELIRPTVFCPAVVKKGVEPACRVVPLADFPTTPGPDDGAPSAFPTPDTHADILLTSGTTGTPKGTIITHGNQCAAARNINAFVGNDTSDVEVLALPLNHSFGLGRMRCQLFAGGTLVLVQGFMFPKRIFAALETWHATGFSFVPAAWALLKRMTGNALSEYAGQLRYIEIGSAPMPTEDKHLLMELLPTTRICMHYGLTEGSRSCFIEFHESADRLDSVGRASPNVTLAILDEAGSVLPPNEAGAIVVQGDHVSTATWTADGIGRREEEWLNTGDLGRIDDTGYAYLLGRAGDIINVGGHKVAPVEIEDVLASHPAVQEAACIGIEDPQALVGSRVKAFLVSAQGPLPSADELESFVRPKLEPYKIPVAFEWIDEIPRNELGKPRRHVLREQEARPRDA